MGGVILQAYVFTKIKYDIAQDISLGHYTHEKPALGCAAILATINYIDDFNLLENCNALSIFARKCSKKLYEKYECIGDIRIIGLLITFEMVKNRISKQQDDEISEKFFIIV